MRSVDLEALHCVAAQLDRLDRPYAFTGGIVVGFLLDHPDVLNLRPTDDLDAITAVTSYAQQAKVEQDLRDLQFIHDLSEGAPTCRFLYEGIKVDLMPARDETGQFDNPWFEAALAAASFRSLKGVTVKTVDAPHFIATKISAFLGRSGGDWYSHDLEDIITVVDGRQNIVGEIERAEPSLRHYIATQLGEWLADESFLDALPGHLPGDAASQRRLPSLLERLRRISSIL
jgi:hypothetical protein